MSAGLHCKPLYSRTCSNFFTRREAHAMWLFFRKRKTNIVMMNRRRRVSDSIHVNRIGSSSPLGSSLIARQIGRRGAGGVILLNGLPHFHIRFSRFTEGRSGFLRRLPFPVEDPSAIGAKVEIV